MDKAALDEFFAQADDVLTDWPGSSDAMNTAPRVRTHPHGAVTITVTPDLTAFTDAIEKVKRNLALLTAAAGKAGVRMAAAFARAFAPQQPVVCAPLGHGFKPDFDLYCTHAGCGLTAEEH